MHYARVQHYRRPVRIYHELQAPDLFRQQAFYRLRQWCEPIAAARTEISIQPMPALGSVPNMALPNTKRAIEAGPRRPATGLAQAHGQEPLPAAQMVGT